MADGQAAGRTNRKCAAVPPIVINGGAPCPAHEGGPDADLSTLSSAGASQPGSLLPQISPHRNVLGSGQPGCGTEVAHSQSQWSNGSAATQSPFKHPSSVFPIKQEPGTAPSPCAMVSPNSRPTRFPFHLPLPSSSHGMHHLHLPNGLASPAFSDVSSIRLSPANLPLSPLSTTEPLRAAFKNRMRSEGRPQRIQLPPLVSSCVCGSNTDLDETNPSPLNPPVKSLSPYLGSGISDIPSFPSIVSPQSSSSHHLSRKRALSTSPLSDLLDFNSLIRQSPNSLVTMLNSGTPLSPNANMNGHHHDHVATGQGTIGHLVGQATPAPAMQYKIQQHKTLIEHNHNSDGTTNTTITNQVTYSAEHAHLMKHSVVPGDQTAQGMMASESMECEDSKPNQVHPDYSLHHHVKEEPQDPYRCMWDDCARNFDDLEDLVQHIENVHIEKGRMEHFVCLWEACPRRQKPFNARYKLLIHMRIHSGEKPNKCTYLGCNKAFSRLENLKIHLRTHTGEKPYVCQFHGCNKSFSNSSDRSKHQKTHYEQKPYACNHPACSKRYTDPSSLRKHLKTHQLQRKKPRSEFQPEEGLDTCLSIQPLQCTHSSGASSGKPAVKSDKVKLSRPRAGKPDKHDHHAPQLVVQHHHPLPHDPPPAYSLEHPPLLSPYSISDRKPPHYYHHLLPAFLSHHMTPTVTPGTLCPPMVLGTEACPPLHISQVDPLASGVQQYQVSPKIAHLSPVSGAFTAGAYTTQPSPNLPTSYMYNSNPGSPMQVAYSPAQPLLRGPSNTNVYMQCNRTDEMTHLVAPPTSSNPGLLRHLPTHPLSDYSHTPTLGGELFAVDGAATMSIASEFPPHHMLPTADPVPNTHF